MNKNNNNIIIEAKSVEQNNLDNLGLDMFVLTCVVLQELTKREVEYIALSRDTTEADLKQRREISAGSAYYVDQCAVRAATNGRVLMIEGIEKAERNVLPVLNNLLENRQELINYWDAFFGCISLVR